MENRARAGSLAVLGLMAGIAFAAPDGAVAPAWRWADPRGTVSGSRRSAAHAVTTGVEEAWSVAFEAGPVISPPVTWDGRLYVLAGDPRGTKTLYAVDLQDGAVLAGRVLRDAPPTQPAVWDHVVYLRTAPDRIEAYRLMGERLTSQWSHRSDVEVADPLVFEGELYIPAGGMHTVEGEARSVLRKVRGGSMVTTWEQTCEGTILGRPALSGKNLYLLLDRGGGVAVQVLRRRDGAYATYGNVADFSPSPGRGSAPEPAITVALDRVIVASPLALASQGGPRWNALVPCQFPDRDPRMDASRSGLVDMRAEPAVATAGAIALTVAEEPYWGIWKGDRAAVLATAGDSPDLFRSVVPPTVLGDVVYFGTWAADLETLEVLWRLPLDRVRFGAVPADGLVIVVDETGVLRAYRERSRK